MFVISFSRTRKARKSEKKRREIPNGPVTGPMAVWKYDDKKEDILVLKNRN